MLSLRLKTGCILIQDTHKSPPSPPFFQSFSRKWSVLKPLKFNNQVLGPLPPFPFLLGGGVNIVFYFYYKRVCFVFEVRQDQQIKNNFPLPPFFPLSFPFSFFSLFFTPNLL